MSDISETSAHWTLQRPEYVELRNIGTQTFQTKYTRVYTYGPVGDQTNKYWRYLRPDSPDILHQDIVLKGGGLSKCFKYAPWIYVMEELSEVDIAQIEVEYSGEDQQIRKDWEQRNLKVRILNDIFKKKCRTSALRH
jgi:hypothetical protein